MYEVTIKKTFSAAHTLIIGGVREDLHGHNFTVEITVSSHELDEEGVVMDFSILREKTDAILADMDHTHLNNLAYFKAVPPTAEQIARYIFERIAGGLSAASIAVSQVTVWESDNARATYRRHARA